jgi:predicted  nucleic acid-binding Zn-ribbon protein
MMEVFEVANPPIRGRYDNPTVPDSLYRQIGEIAATQTGFREDIQEIKQAIAELADERRSSNMAVQNQQHRINAGLADLNQRMANEHKENTRRLDEIVRDISAMKVPIAQFIRLRSRAQSIIAAIVATVGAIWLLAEPAYRYFVEHWLHGS